MNISQEMAELQLMNKDNFKRDKAFDDKIKRGFYFCAVPTPAVPRWLKCW